MRTVGSKGDVTRENLKSAAIELIADHGFEAVTLRMIANRVGIRAGSLYNYIENKQELLSAILTEIMQDLLRDFDENVPTEGDPTDRLLAFVKFHIDSHTQRKKEVFIGNMELRSLDPENHATVVQLRDTYQRKVTEIIVEGATSGLFHVQDPKIASSALIAMLTGVCTWYREGGRLSQEDLVAMYSTMALNLLGKGPATV